MTIVFLCPSFYPKIGGVEKHAFEVAKILRKKGNKIIVVTEDKRSKVETIKGLRIYRFYFGNKSWFKKFVIWKKLWEKRKILEKADIIHCHDVFIWYLPFRFIYLRKKIFTTFHGYETRFPPETKAIFIRKLSEKLSFGNICVGDYIKKWYSTNPTFVTYGAHDGGKIRVRNKQNLDKKSKILFIGRIEKDNGVDIYSKVLEKFEKNDYSFEACGDGSLRKEFERYGKVHGFIADVKPFLKKADVVFASSYLSIVNSLSFKKPVFSVYNNPLKKDYLKMAPFSKYISIKNSPEKIYEEIKTLSKTNSHKLNFAHKWAQNQTWARVVSLYVDLYKL